jgi:hypothetical protein
MKSDSTWLLIGGAVLAYGWYQGWFKGLFGSTAAASAPAAAATTAAASGPPGGAAPCPAGYVSGWPSQQCVPAAGLSGFADYMYRSTGRRIA